GIPHARRRLRVVPPDRPKPPVSRALSFAPLTWPFRLHKSRAALARNCASFFQIASALTVSTGAQKRLPRLSVGGPDPESATGVGDASDTPVADSGSCHPTALRFSSRVMALGSPDDPSQGISGRTGPPCEIREVIGGILYRPGWRAL